MIFYPGWYLKHRIDLMRQYPHEIAPLNQGKLILGKLAFRWNDFLPTGHPSLYSPPRNEALHLVGSVALALTVSVYWVIYQVWDAAFHHWEKSWKYNVQRSIIDKPQGVSSGDKTLCQMIDIISQTKWI